MIPRIMIAGVGSGSGKTVITCGLLRLFTGMGLKAAAFKCGPDYIDPMFHKEILGIPSKNLDLFFTGEELTKGLFLEGASSKDIAVIEGVMGLYDGLLGIREEASSYHLAKALHTPIVLTVDAHGIGRSLLPLIAGFLQFDTEHLIQGILLNNISQGFYDIVKPEIESGLGVKVLGYLPHMADIRLESRHLGLKLPGEVKNLKKQAEKLAGRMKDTVDILGIIQAAKGAGQLPGCLPEEFLTQYVDQNRSLDVKKVPVGIALDEAFCFYYEDNLRLLKRMGAELVFFSPLKDAKLPEGIKGLLLGGGYPENYSGELSENRAMRRAVADGIARGLPSIAECGGFMYLNENLTNQEGNTFAMAGAVKADCRYREKLVRFGYAELAEKKSIFLPPGETVKGHEFHYFDSTDNGQNCWAQKPLSDRGWDCIHEAQDRWWGFPHLYYYSNPNYVKYFIERANAYELSHSY